ncbi:hypothetical protein TREMEDRAFT_69493 [Tremella mesenterica DSM 1558]|uniref:uncharacterized protein n=1 Tax=Tremella mesenterica (strain ATCC 24925 / CBS 8224 / DSM 1558 / NBRC 9311 / NRRL Y-6157 / RJB 2259-6 / UBC 559-6) TaxID=578456 RepID=UPI0003F49604|nr:uncharacterized protein TREMEDRAFT_69493 [Tremella mesenterica DSM 1558]EIW67957.1 hypothetical protein TREMEDRAFT_69493 [Tremella mesenterica DSM 1558]
MDEQTTIAPCCVDGHIHEGTPLGSFEIINGLRTYVVDPNPPTSGKQNVIVIISDIFGVDLLNTKLFADTWAQHEWKVYVPDFLEGDAVDHSHLKTIVPNLRDQAKATAISKAKDAAETAATLGPWLVTHREAVVKPLIEGFVRKLKEDPKVGKIATVGNCWGGRYALILAQENSPVRVDCSVANHPAFLVNSDVEPITSTPCAIFKGDKDVMMTEEQLDEVESVLKGNLGEEKVCVRRYKDAVHGFTVRGDDMIESEKKQKEEAAAEGINFVAKWFAA